MTSKNVFHKGAGFLQILLGIFLKLLMNEYVSSLEERLTKKKEQNNLKL